MQNIIRLSHLNIFRCKTNYLKYLRKWTSKENRNIKQCFNNTEIVNLFGSISYKTVRHIQSECKAIHSMLVKSGLVPICNNEQFYYLRHFSSSAKLNKNQFRESNDQSSGSKKDPDKNNRDEKLKVMYFRSSMFMALAYTVFFVIWYIFASDHEEIKDSLYVSWNEFVHHMLSKGEVKQLIVRPELDKVTIVLYDGAIVKGKKANRTYFYMLIPDSIEIEKKLREAETNLGIKLDQGVPVIYQRPNDVIKYILVTITTLFMASILLSKFSSMPGNFPGNIFSQMTRAKFTLVDPLKGPGKGVRFSDVAGLQEAKTEIMEFVDYLKSPDRYKTLGAKVPKGALLLGPPGCGKTLLAKAVATEANVPFLSMNGSEFIEMIGGLGAARVRDLFKQGKKLAPSIIYIDEIDAIGKKRSESGVDRSNSESEQTLNQLLTEMDGMVSSQEVIVLASTNRAEVLDKALLRPGRFDRHILIDLPTLIERKQIFEQHLKGITLEYKPTSYSSRLAFLSPGFSGADIANVCNEAALHAARFSKVKVTGEDLLYSIDRVIAGIEKRDNTIAPSEKRVVAYHEAGHALVGWLLKHTDALLKVTIVPRTNRALGFSQFTTADQKLYSKEQLFERMCMILGGRVAESLTFNRITTGAQNDLEKVTKIAYSQVQQYGMDQKIGLLSFHPDHTTTNTRKPYSKKLGNYMDQEARLIITEAYKRTEQLLLENNDKLKLIAEALLQKETLTHEDVEKLIGPPPFGKKNLIESAEFENSVQTLEEESQQHP